MATSAELEADIDIASGDPERPVHCQPCAGDGERLISVGYCVNCREYLCQRCYDGHLIPSLTRKHVLLDKDSMAEIDSRHPCQQHNDRDIEYHCPTHSFLGCHVCCFQHQKSCIDIVCIPEFCTSTACSDELEKLNQNLHVVKIKFDGFASEIENKLRTIETKHTESISVIHEFKQEMLDMIKKLEEELVDKADKIKTEETTKLKKLSLKCNEMIKNTQETILRIKRFENMDKNRYLYFNLLKSQETVQMLESAVSIINADLSTKQFVFQKNLNLENLLKTPYGLGSLQLQGMITKVQNVQDIDCNSQNDINISCITGLAMLPGQKLVAADWDIKNKILKLLDMKRYKLQSYLKLSSNPYGVCKINDTLIAITLPCEKTISFIRVDHVLSLERSIKVNGEARGIGYLDGKLVVSYRGPDKVEILDMGTACTLISMIETDKTGLSIFFSPFQLAINPFNKLIYVSNHDNNSVVCMNMDGTIVATYEDIELKHPRQITFDSCGMVYVCSRGSDSVHQLTEDCKKVRLILTKTNGIQQPCSIFYQENEGKLILGQWESNTMKVFQMTNAYV